MLRFTGGGIRLIGKVTEQFRPVVYSSVQVSIKRQPGVVRLRLGPADLVDARYGGDRELDAAESIGQTDTVVTHVDHDGSAQQNAAGAAGLLGRRTARARICTEVSAADDVAL